MPEITAQMVADWCCPSQESHRSFDDVTHEYHALSPRRRFVQCLPYGASMLDAGAGDGAISIYRNWPPPARLDLKMYAWAGIRGHLFDEFEGAEVSYWPQNPPDFGGMKFDAILSSNFIEHLDDPVGFIEWAISRLRPGGRLYLEWPKPESIDLPSNAELAAVGVRVTTGRYHDDGTHRPNLVGVGEVVATLHAHGLDIVEQGDAAVPFIDRELAIQARRRDDLVAMTLAYWSYTSWCTYLVARAPGG